MKKIALLAIALVLVSGCILFPQADRYALFSYLPSEGAKGAVFVDLKESAFTEITSLLGTVLSGKAKDIKGMQIAVLSYDDGSSAGIVQMKTDLGIGDVIAGIPSYYLGVSSLGSQFTNETKQIGDKYVTLLYSRYDTTKDNPICAWREGSFLNVLYYQKRYSGTYSQCTFPAGFTCVSYSLNESGKLNLKMGQGTGHSIRINSILCTAYNDYKAYSNVYVPLANPVSINSGSSADVAGGSSGNTVLCNVSGEVQFSGNVYVNYTETDTGLSRIAVGSLYLPVKSNATEEKRCDTILGNTYDTSKAAELLAESAGMEGMFQPPSNMFGEAMLNTDNQSVYVAVLGDNDGDYGVAISKGGSSSGNLCYSAASTSGSKAEVVTRGAREACFMDYGTGASSLYLPLGPTGQLITAQRKAGDYSVMLVAYAKDNKETVRSNAEDIIFGINLPGEEQSWTDKMNLKVKVYERAAGSLEQQPVADAKVELYNQSSDYPPYTSYGGVSSMEPVKTAYTDDNGIVNFDNLDVGDYTIAASKPGYSKDTGYVYPGGSNNISIMLQPIQPLRVTVRESAYTKGGSYYGSVIAGAKVDLYNNTGGGYSSYSSGYTWVKTVYTNDSGVADFGKMDVDDGKVEVTKEGYYSDTKYVSSYSRNITAYLSKVVSEGELKVDVSESGPDSNYPAVEDAKIELYNRSRGNYTLLKTLYTDSSGIADFGNVSITEGKIEGSKEGYYNSMEVITPINAPRFVTTFAMTLVKVAGNASADYPLTQAGGSGCVNPNKAGAPPEWVIGSTDGKGACFWEAEPLFGTFGKTITFSKLNLTVSPNPISVDKPLEVFTSNNTNCYEEALASNFSSYIEYAIFTPDVENKFEGYAVSNGAVSARCISVSDTTSDGYGYYIDSVRIYQ
ncbi:carboxypeptidase regulatory-like domain-containing protein [Candidatus Micrarchaeota archaeon]|nr:carboxypeptidase regulatory-like domain-containing protein [Candidatus Micrarchaeota archaeon]